MKLKANNVFNMKLNNSVTLKYHHISYNRILPRHNPSFGSSSLFNKTNPHTEKVMSDYRTLLPLFDDKFSASQLGKQMKVETKTIGDAKFKRAYTAFKFDYKKGKHKTAPIIELPELKRMDSIGKTTYLMHFAHELTHVEQIKNGDDPHTLLAQDTISEGFNLKEIDDTFAWHCNYHKEQINGDIMRKACHSVLGQEGLDSYRQNDGLCRANVQVSEEKLANSLGYKNKKEFIANFAKDSVPFDKLIESICNRNSTVAKKCVDSPTQTKAKIKNILIKYFRNSARIEKEAYLSEYKVSQLFGFDDKASKCIYTYQAMVEKAFDYYLKSN